ncbi:MAG TPA: glycosyltransferase 87 family protein [Thermoleophilaceae bacterium]|nr:glycosyltransferase 87 family protein [Thermoleophilaceae bacterium]
MRRALAALTVLVLIALTARAAASMEAGLDYLNDAGDSIDALARGDLQGFVANQPLMGSFSMLLRAPFVAAVFHQSVEAVYFAGAVPCLAATLVLGLTLARLLAEREQPATVQGLAAGLAVINPLTFQALHWGHPEELLAGALCVGAVLAAMRERALTAAVLLGLALATKQWALLAVLPVLLAAPSRRLTVALVAGAIAAALTLPLMLGDPGQFGSVARAAAGQDAIGTSTTPWNVWWPFADKVAVAPFGPRWMAPQWVATVSHPGIVAVALPLSLLLWRRADRRPDDALLLLALLFLLRCLLDNWNNDYYHVPLVLSLLAWESVRRPGVPYLTMAVLILVSASFWPIEDRMFGDSRDHAGVLFALYMAWALPLATGLALLLYRPATAASALAGSVQLLRGEYHRRRGASARPAAVRGRPRRGGDRQLDRPSA